MLQLLKKYQLTHSYSSITTGSIFVILTLFLLAGCAEMAEMDSNSQISRFQNAEDVYRASMRWGEWNGVFQLMRDKPGAVIKLKPPSEDYIAHLETLKVKEVEVLTSSMDKDTNSGQSKLKIGYHRDNSVTIKTLRHTISWWYQKEGNVWFTDTSLPKEFELPKSRTIKLSPKH